MSNNAMTQHGVNALAVAAAPVSIWAHAPEIVTVIAGLLGIIWYSIIITEKILHYAKKRKRRNPDVPDIPIDLHHK